MLCARVDTYVSKGFVWKFWHQNFLSVHMIIVGSCLLSKGVISAGKVVLADYSSLLHCTIHLPHVNDGAIYLCPFRIVATEWRQMRWHNVLETGPSNHMHQIDKDWFDGHTREVSQTLCIFCHTHKYWILKKRREKAACISSTAALREVYFSHMYYGMCCILLPGTQAAFVPELQVPLLTEHCKL